MPHSFFTYYAAPSCLHSTWVPLPICFAHPLGVGPGRHLSSASWLHGYPAVRGCGVDVVLVSCQWRLKYITIEIYMAPPPLPPQCLTLLRSINLRLCYSQYYRDYYQDNIANTGFHLNIRCHFAI